MESHQNLPGILDDLCNPRRVQIESQKNPKKTESLILVFYNDSYIFYLYFSRYLHRAQSFLKTERTRTKKFTNRSVFLLICYSYTVFILDSTNEPNCDLQKKVSVKTPRNKRCELKKKLSGTTFCIIMTMFMKPYFFKTASAPVFRGFLTQKRTKRKGEILDKIS